MEEKSKTPKNEIKENFKNKHPGLCHISKLFGIPPTLLSTYFFYNIFKTISIDKLLSLLSIVKEENTINVILFSIPFIILIICTYLLLNSTSRRKEKTKRLRNTNETELKKLEATNKHNEIMKELDIEEQKVKISQLVLEQRHDLVQSIISNNLPPSDTDSEIHTITRVK